MTNEQIGLYTRSYGQQDRYSNIIVVGDLCKRQCDIKHLLNRRRRQSCKADCESRLGSAQRAEDLRTIVKALEEERENVVQLPINGNGDDKPTTPWGLIIGIPVAIIVLFLGYKAVTAKGK